MPQRQEGEPPPLPSGCELCLREATLDDLDDLVEIVRVGFPDDPEVGYRFPHRDRYPQDYVKWTRREYEGYLAQPGKFVVRVIESTKPIALAVWDIAVLTKSNNSDMGLNERSDADEAHCLKYNQVVADCFGKYFEKYAEKQVHLWLMVTRPEWRRRGAGTMLMRWGMENERVLDHKERWPITAFASPMGKLLYEHLGFDELATECIQIDGEEEKLTFSVMEQPFQS